MGASCEAIHVMSYMLKVSTIEEVSLCHCKCPKFNLLNILQMCLVDACKVKFTFKDMFLYTHHAPLDVYRSEMCAHQERDNNLCTHPHTHPSNEDVHQAHALNSLSRGEGKLCLGDLNAPKKIKTAVSLIKILLYMHSYETCLCTPSIFLWLSP